jgi:hypothetical protein
MKIDKPSERKWHEEERKLTEKIAAVYKFTKKGEFYHPFA